MKQFKNTFRRYLPWLLLLFMVDAFAVLLLWLTNSSALKSLIETILLFSVLLFLGVLLLVTLREQKKQRLFSDFLSHPDPVNEARLLAAVSRQERESLGLLASVLHDQQDQLNQMAEDLHDYEEYVEGWAHEAKTPLSLLTMLLDNHAEEMPPQLQAKLDYVRNQLQEDITQMLYYARLKSSTKDYRFEEVALQSVFEEVLEDYAPILEEKGFVIESKLGDDRVFTDRRGLLFMLGQIISNAIKYSSDAPKLTISMEHPPQKAVLRIRDNGVGVKPYDLPYIFQKGFTGDSTDSQKKATGMGLYLTRKMASDLGVTVEASSKFSEGFQISILFPEIQ